MRIVLTGAVLLALTACGEAPRQQERKAQPAAETGAAAQVAQLDEEQRNGVLAKAIRASGAVDCLTVTHSERAAMMNGVPGWKAQCDNDSAHLIEILADGTAKVTSRSH
ncbi:MAG TPA: hypothetical protein VF475_09505 [Sphingobium sp.]